MSFRRTLRSVFSKNEASLPIVAEIDGKNVQSVRINAFDFGVVADDETIDNTEALQQALDAAGDLGGGVVELPSGRFRFDGCLSLPAGVTLLGVYHVPPTVVNKDEKPTGATFLTYANRGKPEGEPFITLNVSNSAVVGVVITYRVETKRRSTRTLFSLHRLKGYR